MKKGEGPKEDHAVVKGLHSYFCDYPYFHLVLVRLKSETGTALVYKTLKLKLNSIFFKKTVRPCQWGGEAQNFGIQQVYKGEFASMKRFQTWQFEG